MTIRRGTAGDLEALVIMGERFLTMVYAHLIVPNHDALLALAAHLLTGNDAAVFVAEDRSGEAIGMLGLLLYAHPMSAELTASEVMWWVQPEHRGCGLKLYRQGEQWAIDRGAASLQMIAPTPAVARLYERLGFSAIETTYQKRLV